MLKMFYKIHLLLVLSVSTSLMAKEVSNDEVKEVLEGQVPFILKVFRDEGRTYANMLDECVLLPNSMFYEKILTSSQKYYFINSCNREVSKLFNE